MEVKFCLNFWIFFWIIHPILAQYAIPFETPEECAAQKFRDTSYATYFNAAQRKCLDCAQDSSYQETRADGLGCVCAPGYRLTEDYGGDILCEKCPDDEVVSHDGWECLRCDKLLACKPICSQKDQISVERNLDGSWLTGAPEKECMFCSHDTEPNREQTRCERCDQVLSVSGSWGCRCPGSRQAGGVCFRDSGDIQLNSVFMLQVTFEAETFSSRYFQEHLEAAIAMCSDKYGNRTACQHLANICVLILYNKGYYLADTACTVYLEYIERRSNSIRKTLSAAAVTLPLLYYPMNGTPGILRDTSISNQFKLRSSYLDLVASMYSANGTFLGFQPVSGGLLQFCKGPSNMLDAGFAFGVRYIQKCRVSVRQLWNQKLYPTIFYELWLRSTISGESRPTLHEIPIVFSDYVSPTGTSFNKGVDPSLWQLFKRFFLIDNISGAKDGTSSTVGVKAIRYAESITISVNLQENMGYSGGLIYPPYVRVNYTTASLAQYKADDKVTVQFEVVYCNHLQPVRQEMYAVLGILFVIVFIWSSFQTYSWWRRAGKIIFDLATVFKFLLILVGFLGEAAFVVVFCASVWWLVCFKVQKKVIIFGNNPIGAIHYSLLTVIPFIFQTINLAHLILCQVTIDIFFVDWERPSGSFVQRICGLIPTAPMWRTYFIMRKWNELQTVRRINPAYQMIVVLALLTVLGLGNLATEDPSLDVTISAKTYRAPTTYIFRFACFSTVYLIVALVQVVFQWILEHLRARRIWQIVDLCSVANISIFVLETEFSGYYIHGRSPCCKADTNLRQMYYNLLREKEGSNRYRGLLPQRQEQKFQIAVTRMMKLQYNRILLPLLTMPNPGGLVTEELAKTSLKKKEVFVKPEAERSVRAYALMNRYLQGFIDHEFLNCDYIVRQKTLVEQILDYEFEKPINLGYFYTDHGWTFHRLFFYGHERKLLIFEMLLFGIINLFVSDYIFSGITVYFISTVLIATACRAMARVNVAKKSLVDKRFLI